jgi:hypothetical protein
MALNQSFAFTRDLLLQWHVDASFISHLAHLRKVLQIFGVVLMG